MQEKDIISKIKKLKEIKPREEWVMLTKSKVLDYNSGVDIASQKSGSFGSFFGNIFNLTSERRLTYALSSVLLLFVGLFSFAWYILPPDNLEVAKNNQGSALVLKSDIISSIEDIKKLSQELSEIKNSVVTVENNAEDMSKSLAVKEEEVKEAFDSLAVKVSENPQVAKEVVKDEKVLASIFADSEDNNLGEAPNNFYKALVEQEIKDLEASVLNEDGQEKLNQIKELYEEGNYLEALELILKAQ